MDSFVLRVHTDADSFTTAKPDRCMREIRRYPADLHATRTNGTCDRYDEPFTDKWIADTCAQWIDRLVCLWRRGTV